jgi:hypothetical protein
VNEHALGSSQVHLFIADAREWLLTTRARYDLVVSEPSNPYRAGVASLYTQEFYLAVAQRLDARGILVQWLQGYEVDAAAVRTVFGTITSVFPHAELWELSANDLVVLASRDELRWNVGELAARVQQEPYRKALRVALRTEGLEGLLARLRGRAPFVRLVAGDTPVLNTDDQNLLEFAFARTLGRMDYSNVGQLLKAARTAGLDRPPAPAAIDWQRVTDEYASTGAAHERGFADPRVDSSVLARTAAKRAWGEGNLSEAWKHWKRQPDPPRFPVERLLAAECATAAGSSEAPELVRLLAPTQPTEAVLIGARARCPGDVDGCAAELVRGIEALRGDPWVYFPVARRFLGLVRSTVNEQPKADPRVIGALGVPFAVRNLEETRRELFLDLTTALGRPECRSAHEAVEPYPTWNRPALQRRVRCYELTQSLYLDRARSDLAEFLAGEPSRFE